MTELIIESRRATASCPFPKSDDDSGVAFRTGLGMSYQVSEQLRLRADWDFLVNVGDEDETGEADINVFSVGPEFLF